MSATPEDELNLRPQEQETVDSFERQRRWVVGGAAVLAVVGLSAALSGIWMLHSEALDSPSALGDYVAGTAGPLWALAGVLLVYLAFVGQRVQLVYQQAELRATRLEFGQQTDALEGQQTEMERQVMESKRQTFDNAFFQMLQLYNDILAETGVEGHGRNSAEMDRGRDAFAEFVSRHRNRYAKAFEDAASSALAAEGDPLPTKEPGMVAGAFDNRLARYRERLEARMNEMESGQTEAERGAAALDAYRGLYTAHQHEIGHYFRTLYHVVKFVDRADPGVVPNKQQYVSIVRSQLSSPELALLAYNGLTHGREKFKPLMERYGLLKQMPSDDITDSLRLAYEAGAFGGWSKPASSEVWKDA